MMQVKYTANCTDCDLHNSMCLSPWKWTTVKALEELNREGTSEEHDRLHASSYLRVVMLDVIQITIKAWTNKKKLKSNWRPWTTSWVIVITAAHGWDCDVESREEGARSYYVRSPKSMSRAPLQVLKFITERGLFCGADNSNPIWTPTFCKIHGKTRESLETVMWLTNHGRDPEKAWHFCPSSNMTHV